MTWTKEQHDAARERCNRELRISDPQSSFYGYALQDLPAALDHIEELEKRADELRKEVLMALESAALARNEADLRQVEIGLKVLPAVLEHLDVLIAIDRLTEIKLLKETLGAAKVGTA